MLSNLFPIFKETVITHIASVLVQLLWDKQPVASGHVSWVISTRQTLAENAIEMVKGEGKAGAFTEFKSYVFSQNTLQSPRCKPNVKSHIKTNFC